MVKDALLIDLRIGQVHLRTLKKNIKNLSCGKKYKIESKRLNLKCLKKLNY